MHEVAPEWAARVPAFLAQLRALGELISEGTTWRLILRVRLSEHSKRELGTLARAMGYTLEISGVRYE